MFLFRNRCIDVNQEIREIIAGVDVLINWEQYNLQTYHNVLLDYIKRQDVDNIFEVLHSLEETIRYINTKVQNPKPDISDFIQ